MSIVVDYTESEIRSFVEHHISAFSIGRKSDICLQFRYETKDFSNQQNKNERRDENDC